MYFAVKKCFPLFAFVTFVQKTPFLKSGDKKCQKVTKRDKKCHLASSLQKVTPENMPLHGQETVKFWMLYQPLTTNDPQLGKVSAFRFVPFRPQPAGPPSYRFNPAFVSLLFNCCFGFKSVLRWGVWPPHRQQPNREQDDKGHARCERHYLE